MSKNHSENQNDVDKDTHVSRSSLNRYLSKEEFERQAKQFALQQGFSLDPEDKADTIGLYIVPNEEELEKYWRQLDQDKEEWEERLKHKLEKKHKDTK